MFATAGSVTTALVLGVTLWVSPAFSSGLDRSIADVRAKLAPLLACTTWDGDERNSGCQSPATGGRADLYRDPESGTVGTVWLAALVAAHPQRRPDEEARARKVAITVVLTVLPEWKNGTAWLTRAISDARHPGSRRVTKVGPVNVLIQHLQPADVNNTYAEIILTKRAVGDWLYREDVGDIERRPPDGADLNGTFSEASIPGQSDQEMVEQREPDARKPRSGLDRPIGDLQAALGSLLGCVEWHGTEAVRQCAEPRMNSFIDLHRDPGDDTVETIELSPVIVAHPSRRSVDVKRSREIATRVVLAVLPGWKQGPAWLARAFDDARHWRARHVVEIGQVTVRVQHLQPADLNDTFAEVVLTKRSSLEQWTYNNW